LISHSSVTVLFCTSCLILSSDGTASFLSASSDAAAGAVLLRKQKAVEPEKAASSPAEGTGGINISHPQRSEGSTSLQTTHDIPNDQNPNNFQRESKGEEKKVIKKSFFYCILKIIYI